MKRFLIGVCLLTLAFASGASADNQTQTGSYVTGPFFVEDCDLGMGVVCFSVFAQGVQTLRIDVDDQWPFPVTAHAEVFGPGGVPIGGGDQFCDAQTIDLGGQDVAHVIVHVGGFMRGECGPIPFMDPFEGGEGSFTPSTVGTVTITY